MLTREYVTARVEAADLEDTVYDDEAGLNYEVINKPRVIDLIMELLDAERQT